MADKAAAAVEEPGQLLLVEEFDSDLFRRRLAALPLDGSWTGHARGLCARHICDRSGRLVASIAREGLMRLRRAR